MPTPDIIYIPYPYPWKRTYCGSELVYDPSMCYSENDDGEQSGEEGAAVIKSEPVSQHNAGSTLPVEKDGYVFVARCGPEEDGREFYDMPKDAGVSSPGSRHNSPVPGDAVPTNVVRVERTLSQAVKVERTGSDEDERTDSGLKTPDPCVEPGGALKLERFSPCRTKTGVRDDSVPLDERPAKRVRFESPVPETCQA